MTVHEAIEIDPLLVGQISVWIRGRTPFICNRLGAKAAQELLFPSGKKSAADKQQLLKHDPVKEYRSSMHMHSGNHPSRLVFPASGLKGSMATAALETKGTNKTQIGRLVWVNGYELPLFGVPELFMSVVRQADMNKTPDIRTRAILREWCMPATIQFVKPQMAEKGMLQLLANGGIIIGMGDFRQEKGKGSFGQFEVVPEAECKEIVKAGSAKAQDEAIANPVCFDTETERLLSWFLEEVKARGKEGLLAAA
jgi:hypothetical protein